MGIRTSFSPFGITHVNRYCNAIAYVAKIPSSNYTLTTQFVVTASGSWELDWGDGIKETKIGTCIPTHTYSESGDYAIVIKNLSGLITETRWVNTSISFTSTAYELLSIDIKSLTHIGGMFLNCSSLHGNISSLSESITIMQSTFDSCSSLDMNPIFSKNVVNVYAAYRNCKNLHGTITKWPEKITQASYCFYSCSSITGVWSSAAADLMPSTITAHAECVTGCDDTAVRQYFTADWGGTKA